MTQEQFTLRLLLTIVVGVAFIMVLMKLAIRNSSTTTKTHIVFKVLGGILVTLAVIAGVSGAIICSRGIEHSQTTIEAITGIVRPTSSTLYWGYPTASQNLALSNFMNLFVIGGFGLYFLNFKASPISWWKKVLKALSLIIMLFLMYSSTNLHYFDWWELWPNLLLIAIVFCSFKFANKAPDTIIENVSSSNNISDKSIDIIIGDKTNAGVVFDTEDVEL